MSATSMVMSTVARISATSTVARNSPLYKEGASEFSLSVPEMPPNCTCCMQTYGYAYRSELAM